jgi:predicted enzyme related to lactoylglutathione lyase
MASNPVTWFEIAVSDIERAKRFYETLFALSLTKLPTPGGDDYWTFPKSETLMGAGGALTTMEGMQPGGGGTLIYFSCEDCSVEQARVEPAGGKVLQPKMQIADYGFIAICLDTEGNRIGLHSER